MERLSSEPSGDAGDVRQARPGIDQRLDVECHAGANELERRGDRRPTRRGREERVPIPAGQDRQDPHGLEVEVVEPDTDRVGGRDERRTTSAAPSSASVARPAGKSIPQLTASGSDPRCVG
jgi:hypothetical protein